MVQVITTVLSLAAIVLALFSPMWAWALLILPVAFLLVVLQSQKNKRWDYIPELSPEANEMLQRFGHFYNMPFAGASFSASASTLMMAGALVAIIGCYHSFWWGLGIGLVNYRVMGGVARAFNPSEFLLDESEKEAHREIVSHIQRKPAERN